MDFLTELWRFAKYRKKYWLLPLILAMIVVGWLLAATHGTVVGPFLYPLF